MWDSELAFTIWATFCGFLAVCCTIDITIRVVELRRRRRLDELHQEGAGLCQCGRKDGAR